MSRIRVYIEQHVLEKVVGLAGLILPPDARFLTLELDTERYPNRVCLTWSTRIIRGDWDTWAEHVVGELPPGAPPERVRRVPFPDFSGVPRPEPVKLVVQKADVQPAADPEPEDEPESVDGGDGDGTDERRRTRRGKMKRGWSGPPV